MPRHRLSANPAPKLKNYRVDLPGGRSHTVRADSAGGAARMFARLLPRGWRILGSPRSTLSGSMVTISTGARHFDATIKAD